MVHADEAVFLQCSGCLYRWWRDTEFGEGDRPADIDEVDDLAAYWFDAA